MSKMLLIFSAFDSIAHTTHKMEKSTIKYSQFVQISDLNKHRKRQLIYEVSFSMFIETRNSLHFLALAMNFGTWQNRYTEDFLFSRYPKLTALHVNFSLWKTLGIYTTIIYQYHVFYFLNTYYYIEKHPSNNKLIIKTH